MPLYEFRCRTCDDVFEVSRPMARASDPAECPSGHQDSVKLLSRVMMVGRAGSQSETMSPAGGSMGGGCCGGGCGCH